LQSEIASIDQGSIRELLPNVMPNKQLLTKFDEKEFNRVNRDKPEIDEPVVIPKINIVETLHVSYNESYIEPAIHSFQPTQKTSVAENVAKYGYTIQLQASHNLKDIHHFIARHHLKDNYNIRRVTLNEDSWFVLTLGNYNRLDQAQNAIRALPPTFLNLKPWVRKTTQLQLIG
jgi:hypothetical protein